jgi:vancomycin permeability regulator SanA
VLLIGGRDISAPDDIGNLKNADCILVLGCQVKADGTPSHMLQDRLERAIALYQTPGIRTKLLMSGDHGREGYNEVGTMRQYAIDRGVPAEDIFMDHAGFSTYESIYRAKHIFGAKKIIIVTQKYHLYRALYIAWALGVDAEGVDPNYRSYYGQFGRECREVLARVKDLGMCIFKPKPTYLGDPIDLRGSGEVTNDMQPGG